MSELHDKRVKIISNIDITKKESLEKYFKNVDYVIHLAALISFWYKDREKMYDINITGTKNVVELCLKYRIKRLIHASSTAAINGSKKIIEPADETYGFSWKEKSKYDYGISKYCAEKEVERGGKSGLDVVITNPCTIIGYGDTKIFPLVETVLKKIPICFSGGSHMIDVRDLARGIVLLITTGKTGERYLLVGAYHTQKEILTKLSRILEVRPPVFVISSKVLILVTPVLALNDFLAKKRPNLTKTMVENGLFPNYYSNLKSQKLLSWKPKYSLDESLKEVVNYYIEEKK